MTKKKESFSDKIKSYHIILLSCLLCSLLILNSNYVNEQRAKEKLNQEKSELFDRILSLRKLDSQIEENSNSKEVCSRASDDLKEYYQTGDLELINLDDDPIKCEEKDESYMKALRGLMKNLVGGDSDEGSGDVSPHRNLDEGDSDTDNIIQYATDRVLPMAVFLVIGILSIFGWIGCCIFCCCDCCCCCCCKKPGCKIPCFIFSYVFYALVVAVSIYGLSQSNKIFTGLANTECSLLKFFDQVIDGEMKQEPPRWAGINGINGILTGLKTNINEMGRGTYDALTEKIEEVDNKKNIFSRYIQEAGDIFFETNSQYKNVYLTTNYDGYPKIQSVSEIEPSGRYALDLVKNFGRYENSQFTQYSILYYWNLEYSTISKESDNYMETAKDSFEDVLQTNLGSINDALGDAESILNDLREPFDEVNDEIGDALADYSEYIDDYGKLAVKLVFSVLMAMNIILAASITLIGLFSMKACVDCCFCRCIFKSILHILWNILALFMILAFIVGSLLALIGRIGGDVMSLMSFIFSEDNFNDPNPLFLNEMGDGKRYIERCILGDGNIAAELNISDQIGSMDQISSIERNITIVHNEFSSLRDNPLVYNQTVTNLTNRYKLTDNFYLFSIDSQPKPQLSFDDVIKSMNNKISQVYPSNPDTWARDAPEESCSTGEPNGKTLNPSKCDPLNKYAGISNEDIKKYARIITESYSLVSKANDRSISGDDPSLINVLEQLKTQYQTYLDGYVDILKFLKEKIGKIMNVTRDYTKEGEAFSFLNGKFINNNLKIMLKYLKNALGQNLYTVGVCLILVGCSLILSISSTILLIVIINIDLKSNQTQRPQPDQAQGPPNIIISDYQPNANTPY